MAGFIRFLTFVIVKLARLNQRSTLEELATTVRYLIIEGLGFMHKSAPGVSYGLRWMPEI